MPRTDWYPEETIFDIIEKIDSNQIFLPALQRKFVWKTKQIEQLFDSIMQGFPIGTFLFWKVNDPKVIKDFVFYKFISHYKQYESRNDRQEMSGVKNQIISVIDGQQRLTSMYIALRGSYKYKTPKKHRSNPDAFPSRYLYINLIPKKKNNVEYEFKFLLKKEAEIFRENAIWYKVTNILNWESTASANADYKKLKISSSEPDIITKNKTDIFETLKKLYKRLCKEKYIAHFDLYDKRLDEVLDIFIRVNNGGTVLSKTELLMSTVTANWEVARTEVENLIGGINRLGRGFKFDIDFVMRVCLVLLDEPVLFKVESFDIRKVDKIEGNWKQISEAISHTTQLLVDFGFDALTLTSKNAVIPIIYYIYKGGIYKKDKERKEIKRYLQHTLLTGFFGSHGDQALQNIREALTKLSSNDERVLRSKRFNFSDLRGEINPMPGKTLELNPENIEQIMEYKKGRQAFVALSMLYPNLKYNEIEFDQDHIHPSFLFTEKKLKEAGKSFDEIEKLQKMKDQLPNLQMMEGRKNRQKNKTPFDDWLEKNFYNENKMKQKEKQKSDKSSKLSTIYDSGPLNQTRNVKTSKEVYLETNYIPKNIDYNINNFELFFQKRKEILIRELTKILDN